MKSNTRLAFTGERFLPEISGNIELEHMHRYIYALAYARGKTVLDIASGEGYGTALLATEAAFVTGVDIAEDAVAHARQKYRLPNLEFRFGSSSKIPLPDATVDFVVSFETIEHHDEHEQMLVEIKRVLKPGGMAIVSSPDKAIYTDKSDYHNPFHVKELYRDEFEALFRTRFKNVVSLGQKVMFGSGIIPVGEGTQTAFTSVDLGGTTSRPGLVEAMYNLIMASDAALPAASSSFLDVGIDASETVKTWKAAVAQRDGDIQRLQGELAAHQRRLDGIIAGKDAQIAEYLYHLDRFNASGWWRLGLFLDRLIRAPLRLVGHQRSNLKAGHTGPLADLQFPIDKLSSDRDTVIVIIHEASRTGAPILAWNMAEELRKRYNVVVLLMRGGSIEQALGESAAAVVRLPDHFPTHGGGVEAVVERLVTVYSPIFVIANSVETRYFVPDFEMMGVPVVALVHEFSGLYRPIGLLSSLFEMASQIVFPARTVAEAAAKDYRSLEQRDFEILPQGPSKLPPSTYPSTSNAAAKTDVKRLWPTDSKDSLLVVGMGSIIIRKGVDFFISTAAAVHRAMPNHEIRFAWVGKCASFDQPYLEYLKEQIERSGLTDTFAFIEEVEDLKPIYDQADIFFLSSRLDPLPNVAIDSAFNGIPVVCFDRASGMAEILAETADTRELVVPYLDGGAAAQLICNLADNPARLARLSQAVRTVAEAHFNMARYVEAIDELGRNAKTVRDQVKRRCVTTHVKSQTR